MISIVLKVVFIFACLLSVVLSIALLATPEIQLIFFGGVFGILVFFVCIKFAVDILIYMENRDE